MGLLLTKKDIQAEVSLQQQKLEFTQQFGYGSNVYPHLFQGLRDPRATVLFEATLRYEYVCSY